jgi:glycosyltransferase involved in cell wall biosynthesis
MAPSLSVLVPALNEQRDLEPTVRQLIRVVGGVCEDFEIIIVNDGSTDRTGAIAQRLVQEEPRVRLLENPSNRGLGYSYARGVREASKTHFVYVPGDNTWPESSIGEILRHLGKADVITSYATNPEVRVGFRRLVSTAYTVALNTLFGHTMRYFNGLSVYPREFLLTRPITTWGFGFQAETLLKALDAGLSVVEVGVPIDEAAARKSRALSLRNFLSVVKTVVTTFWTLRVARHRISASAGLR